MPAISQEHRVAFRSAPVLMVCASALVSTSTFAYEPVLPLGQLPGLTEGVTVKDPGLNTEPLGDVYSGSKAVLSPQFSVEMVHEFDDDQRQIESGYVHDPRNVPLVIVTDSPDRNDYTVGFGLSAVLLNSVQLYGDVRSLPGLDDLNELAVSAGIRIEI